MATALMPSCCARSKTWERDLGVVHQPAGHFLADPAVGVELQTDRISVLFDLLLKILDRLLPLHRVNPDVEDEAIGPALLRLEPFLH